MAKRKLLVGLALAAITLVIVGVWPGGNPQPRARLQVENYPRIQIGMSQAEVEALLGGPPGNYGKYADGGWMMTAEGYIAPTGSVERIWCDDSTRYEIYFDNKGCVAGHHRRAGYQQTPRESLLAWLRRSLGF
jgi:hypothetical protein